MIIRTWPLLLLASLILPLPARATPESFVVTDAVADHFLVREKGHTAHIIRFKQGAPRLLFAFPGGNSGALIEFSKETPPIRSQRVLTLSKGRSGDGSRASVEVTFSGNSATVERVVMGSLRELRRFIATGDLTHEKDTVTAFEEAAGKLTEEHRNRLEREGIFITQPRDTLASNWRAGNIGDRRVLTISRQEYLGDKEYRLSLSLPTTCQTLGGRQLRMNCPQTEELAIQVEVFSPHQPLSPLSDDNLLHAEARAFLSAPKGPNTGPEVVALLERAYKSLSFLAYGDKLLAGSHRFLTYFGRDTLLTTRMLLPVAAEGLVDAALESVCRRLSPEGRVAHEEAIGNEAILQHLQQFTELVDEGRLEPALEILRRYHEPVMDYTMVDDDFLLAPLVRDLLVVPAPGLDDDGRQRLLAGTDGTRLSCLAQNFEYVLLMGSAEGLLPNGIPLAEGVQVGNWRDSQEGLAKGRYPGDVNAYLVPAALVAIGEILNQPLTSKAGLHGLLEKGPYPSLYRASMDPDWLDSLLRRYEKVTATYRVVRPLPHLRSAVKEFLGKADASSRAYFEKLEVEPGCSLATFARGHCYPADLAEGLPQVALALDAQGNPIPVLHSDGVLALFDNPLPVDQLEAVLKAFIYPYPLGLWTDVGPVVANPAAGGNPDWQQMFGADRYHGAVVWGWVVGMLELGLRRQQAYLQELAGECGGACEELARLEALLEKLRRRIPALAAAELWSWEVRDGRLDPVAFGSRSSHATQSNPAQLWSTVWLSVYYSQRK
jgi:hypothetical protein